MAANPSQIEHVSQCAPAWILFGYLFPALMYWEWELLPIETIPLQHGLGVVATPCIADSSYGCSFLLEQSHGAIPLSSSRNMLLSLVLAKAHSCI